MSFIAFDGKGYNSFVAESTNLVRYLHYCACGPKGRGIGLITNKPLPPL
jgi:hypothetical protein